MVVLPPVNGSVMLEVPTIVELVVSKKCVGSVLVMVIVSLEGGTAGIDTLPCSIMLLPIIGALTLISGAVTVATICTLVDGVVYPLGGAKFKLVVPAVTGWKLIADVW